MNNKKLGTAFENEICELLKSRGYWVHFISPDMRGAQPFDIIAVKNKIAYAIDCKTSVNHIFSMRRVEDNQALSFDLWLSKNNTMPMFLVKYNDDIKVVWWNEIKEKGKVDLNECDNF